MLYHDHTRRHNEVVRCIHLGLKYIIYMYYHCGVLANKLGQEYRCRTWIIPYVMTWDGVVTKYHRQHLKDIEMTESYIQTIVLKKTLENISFEYRRGAERLDETEDKPVQSREQRAGARGRSSSLPGKN
ncbi:hypothetical protein PAEPH01_0785 [Pancytospora epiphaga]|nr:hypothetical protein PAEPH01_0785 [Pancytospora epiphaga]